MLVFKNATNEFLISRDVLASHPDTKPHFEALIGSKQQTIPPTSKKTKDELKEFVKVDKCQTKHCDRGSDDDDEVLETNHPARCSGKR